jgi:L-asparaginase / beta-aspartyl-peptidase
MTCEEKMQETVFRNRRGWRVAILACTLATFSAAGAAAPADQCIAHARFAIVVHGGEMSKPVEDNGRLAVMRDTLAKARAALAGGAHSLDVVEMVVRTFEDSGVFNAGRGAIANAGGFVETDASIMDGRDLNAGSVASMTHVKNPVAAARLVMEKSPHVLMVGDRGETYVHALGAETVEASYFLRNAKPPQPTERSHGTVGAVALDRCGHIAAATSTGGYDAKVPGRVGDSPVVGAGVYADDAVGGFSATGHGELFIRYSIAKDVADRMRYLHEPLAVAMRFDILRRLDPKHGGDGALIGLDRRGNVAMIWNAAGMFRGYATDAEAPVVAQYEGPTTNRRRR